MRSKAKTTLGLCLLISLLGCALAAGARAAVEVRAPGLSPAFRPSIPDYTVSCRKSFRLSVLAPGATEARIGEGRWFAERRARRVNLSEGQAIRVATRRGDEVRRHWIRCLPEDFPSFEFTRRSRPSAAHYIVSPLPQGSATENYVFIFDRWGVPVWWLRGDLGASDAKVLDDGSIAWSHYLGGTFGQDPRQAYEVHSPDGRLVASIATVGAIADHHDLQMTADGNYMLLSYRRRSGVDTSAFTGNPGDTDSEVLDGVVQTVDPQGNLVSEWSTAGHIGLGETGRWWSNLAGAEVYDVVHLNSIEPLPGGDFIVSMRHTDAVYRVDGASGAIEWKLGGTPTPDSLSVVDDPYGDYPFGGQHDARFVDGTVSVHDNATGLAHAPRGVRYVVSGSTATLVDSVGDPLAPRSSSFCCGSARYDPIDGSWLLEWGGTAVLTEFDRARHRTFLLVWGDATFSYRAVAVPGALTRDRLIAGMNEQVPPKD